MSTQPSKPELKTQAQAIPSPSGPGVQTAHPQPAEDEWHVNADLYRTFSPTDVAMWDWRSLVNNTASNSGTAINNSKPSGGILGKLFGFKSS